MPGCSDWVKRSVGHVAKLRDQREPNINDLLRFVTESVAANRVCQGRIEAVDTLQAALGSEGSEGTRNLN